MPRRPPATVTGIVASFRGGIQNVPSEVRQAAHRRGIELRPVNAASIGQFVGKALRQIPIWLILFNEQNDTDLLMVPYPDEFRKAEWNDGTRRAADNLFEWIRADRNRPWTVGKGHQNLVVAESSGRLPQSARCFQAIRLPAPLGKYLDAAIPQVQSAVEQNYADRFGNLFREAAQKIDEKRRVLRESLAGVNETEPEQARESFDDFLVDEATRIAGHARIDGIVREPPLLAFLRNELGNCGLDPESMRFLETALLVEEMAVQMPGSRLDFSAAACPLWKMFELELNLSVGWLVRLLRRVASHESARLARPDRDPLDRVEVSTGREPHQRVELNTRIPAGNQRLKGLMLGPIQFLLAFGRENGVRDEILGKLLSSEWTPDSLDRFLFSNTRRAQGSVQGAIRRISDLRNCHAHDTAMDRSNYDRLKILILGPSDGEPALSLVGRLLSLKKCALEFAAAWITES